MSTFEVIVVSYFIVNLGGAIYEVIRQLVKPRHNNPQDEAMLIYNSLNRKAKFALNVLTFVINCVIWLAFRLLKPLMRPDQ